MKGSLRDSEKVLWDPVMKFSSGNAVHASSVPPPPRLFPRLLLWLILFASVSYVLYIIKLVSTPTSCSDEMSFSSSHHRHESIRLAVNVTTDPTAVHDAISLGDNKTEIRHLMFGIAGSAKLWSRRKEYIKTWYKPSAMRGAVWLEAEVEMSEEEKSLLPPVRISEKTSKFLYTNKKGDRSALRISRIVSEMVRMSHPDVRWFVMGDDDTVFVTDNLLRVLRKYDHEQFYYIGSSSESHLQNIYFSYGMAYGGGGFAISYPLARALERVQDRCIMRYPGLYGSDDRIHACMAELGVPLTKELGFHQYDVYGNLVGLLAAHPVAPFISLHHLDVVEAIFPNMSRVEAIEKLAEPAKVDSAAMMQQSICYDKARQWTVSVSWGYAVQIFRGIFSPREMEMPSRTFLNWYRKADYTAYAFNTRPVSRNICQKPFLFYLSQASFNSTLNSTVTVYDRHNVSHPYCRWKMPNPETLHSVVVVKAPDPHLWDRSPRRNCCRVMASNEGDNIITVDVGLCRKGEISEA